MDKSFLIDRDIPLMAIFCFERFTTKNDNRYGYSAIHSTVLCPRLSHVYLILELPLVQPVLPAQQRFLLLSALEQQALGELHTVRQRLQYRVR